MIKADDYPLLFFINNKIISFLVVNKKLTMKKLFDNILSFFYPRICVACGQALQQHEELLCLRCMLHLPETHFHKEHDNSLKYLCRTCEGGGGGIADVL